MDSLGRRLTISLPAGQSAFLWGPRKTGETTHLASAFPNSLVYDFLRTDLALVTTCASGGRRRASRWTSSWARERWPSRSRGPIASTAATCDLCGPSSASTHRGSLWSAATSPAERVVDDIRILPWRTFLHALWEGSIVGRRAHPA